MALAMVVFPEPEPPATPITRVVTWGLIALLGVNSLESLAPFWECGHCARPPTLENVVGFVEHVRAAGDPSARVFSSLQDSA